MLKLDPNKFFESFQEEYYAGVQEPSVSDVFYESLRNFQGFMQRYLQLSRMYKAKFPDKFESVEDSYKYKYFIIVYSTISGLNIEYIKDALKIEQLRYPEGIHESLQELLDYFEELEYYEYCAKILNIKKLVTSSLQLTTCL